MQRRLPPVPQAEGHQRHPSTDLNHFSTPSFATPQLPSPAQIPQSPVGGSNNVSNSDTSPAQEGASEPDQPRAKRTKKQFPGRNLPKTSCLRCKSKKMRCESSEQTSGICKRCEKGRFVCEYQVPDGKPKNGRLTKRIEQLEQTISHLKTRPASLLKSAIHPDIDYTTQSEERLARLEQTLLDYTDQLAAVQKKQQQRQQQGQAPSFSVQHDNYSQFSETLPIQAPSITPSLPNASPHSAAPSFNPSDPRDAIDQGLCTLTEACMLLNTFRTMCHSFPYLVLPASATITSLRQSNPMLLLALLAAASYANRPLQQQLEKAYLRVLGLRMVVEGEQSLDMLQSLLVHLAWCHFHLKSAYRLTAYASSLVINMGLNREPAMNKAGGTAQERQNLQKLSVKLPFPNGSRSHSPEPASEQPQNGASDEKRTRWCAGARRTYIGIYLICTSYSHALRKAGILRYSPYLLECATSLPLETGLVSDEFLIHYVRLVHHAEQVCDTFNYDSSSSLSGVSINGTLPEEQLAFYVRTFNASYAAIIAQISPHFANSTMLATYSLMVSAYTQEIGLHGLSSSSNNTLSITRTQILTTCLITIRRILDIVTNLTPLEFLTLPGFSWARTHYILNLASELSTSIVSPSWDIESVRGIIQLETYIDAYVARLEEQSRIIEKGGETREEKGKDWFAFLAVQWRKVRREYIEGLAKRGIIVSEQLEHWSPGWDIDGLSLLGEMDFMPQEWFWNLEGEPGGDVI